MCDFASGGVTTYVYDMPPSRREAGDKAGSGAADPLNPLADGRRVTYSYDIAAIIRPDGTVEKRPEGLGGSTWFGGGGAAEE